MSISDLQSTLRVTRDPTPTEILAGRIADLEARLQLADERIFFLVAELAKANARLGITDFKTEAKP